MKKIQKMCFLALVGLMVGTSCEKTSNPDPQTECIEGVVIRWDCPSLTTVQITKGGNIGAVYTNYAGTQTYSNAVTITNTQLADSLRVTYAIGEKIYFTIDKSDPTWSQKQPSPCHANVASWISKKAYSIYNVPQI